MYNHIGMITRQLTSLANSWDIKAAIGGALMFTTVLCKSDHAEYFMYFNILVILDLITKQLSLSAKHIAKTQHIEIQDVKLKSKFKGLRAAFNAGVINSLFMREKFCSKISIYIIVVIGAALADRMVKSAMFTSFVIGYLGANEFLSILENMRDSGNKSVGRLLDLINKKINKL